MQLDVNRKTALARLKRMDKKGEFLKYPSMFMKNSCLVRVNSDDYLKEDEFIVVSNYFNLPKQIFLYGKRDSSEDTLYINQWMEIFLKTIEKGYISKSNFEKSSLNYELTIGLSRDFRKSAYNSRSWTRDNIAEFLSCLFDTKLSEISYQQQDILELMVA